MIFRRLGIIKHDSTEKKTETVQEFSWDQKAEPMFNNVGLHGVPSTTQHAYNAANNSFTNTVLPAGGRWQHIMNFKLNRLLRLQEHAICVPIMTARRQAPLYRKHRTLMISMGVTHLGPGLSIGFRFRRHGSLQLDRKSYIFTAQYNHRWQLYELQIIIM